MTASKSTSFLPLVAILALASWHCGASTAPALDADVAAIDATAMDSTSDVQCQISCAAPPPGCRYVGEVQCNPPRCPPIECMDAGERDVPDPIDSGERRCRDSAGCGRGEVCQFDMGCGATTGRCTSDGCQSLPVAPQYCGCDGRTIQGTSACLPAQSWASMGPCRADAGSDATPDAGSRFACGESTCDATRQFCERPRGPGICPPPGGAVCPRGCPGCPPLPPASCAPLPAPCAAMPTCDCVSAALCGSPRAAMCTGDARSGITVGCLGV